MVAAAISQVSMAVQRRDFFDKLPKTAMCVD